MSPRGPFYFLKRLLPVGKDKDDVPPVGLRWRSNTFFIIATIAMGMFTDLFLYGLIVPVFPFMLEERIGTPPAQVQDLVDVMLSIYAAASCCASPLAGFLSDRIATTRQMPFLAGLSALLVATVMLALGRTVATLAIARFLQGASSGVVWTVGLAMCLETVGAKNLGKTIGTIFSVITAGSIFAPVLGGLLYEKTGYAGVFAVGVAFLAIDFIMRLLVIEKRVAAQYGLFDDQEESSASNDERRDGQPNENTTLLGNSRTAEGADRQIDESYIIPPPSNRLIKRVPVLACFQSPALIVAFLIGLAQAFFLSSFDATVPLVAITWYGFSPLKAGLLFLPIGLADLIIGPPAGWAVDHFGTKPAAMIGFGVLTPVFALLRLPHAGGSDQVALYCVLLALAGTGLSVAGTPSIVEAGAVMEKYNDANPELFGANGPYAQLYGLSSMLFSLGLTLGPLIAGSLKERIGYGNMGAVLAGMSFVMLLLSTIYVGRPIRLNWRKT